MTDVTKVNTHTLQQKQHKRTLGQRLSGLHISDSIIVACIAAACLLYVGGVVFRDTYDNDVWFFLATGRYILEHGIPYINPFSIQPDMGFIAQQWLHCVISYFIYSKSGFVGMGIWTCILIVLFAVSLLALGWKLRGTKRGSNVVMIIVFVSLLGMTTYFNVRPHIYSMLAYTWVIWFCESYRRSGNKKYLCALPLIAVLHVNLHAALAPFDLFIIACYAFPNVLKPLQKRGHLCKIYFVQNTYARLPLLIVLALSAFALLINPYGIKGALYVILSFGSASYRSIIYEMQPFVPASRFDTVFVTVILFITIAAIARVGIRQINAPLCVLVLVCTVGTLAYVRNIWLGTLFCCIYLMWASTRLYYQRSSSRSKPQIRAAACILLIGVIGMAAFMVYAAPSLAKKPEDSASTPISTMDYLDSLDADKETTKVFTFFNAGGYIEYRGYKVNIDPRPEIWNAAINNKGFNYYYEYVQMSKGDMDFTNYNNRYDFDVFIIESKAGTDPYFEDNDTYVEITGGRGYRSYAKKSWLEQYVQL